MLDYMMVTCRRGTQTNTDNASGLTVNSDDQWSVNSMAALFRLNQPEWPKLACYERY